MIEIRFLKPGDEIWIHRIAKAFRHDEIDDEKAKDILNRGTVLVGAAMDEDKICGYALAYLLPRLDSGHDVLYFYHLFVLDEYQNQGIGTRLVQMLIDYANEHQLHYFYLITQHDNEKACRLYEKLGGERHPKNDTTYYWYVTGKPKV